MSTTKRHGVTLVEVLVVVAILAVLIGLLLPAVQHVRLSAVRAEAIHSARQLLLAAHAFSDSRAGRLPSLAGDPPNPGRSALEALCPHLEADPDAPPKWFRLRSDSSGEKWVTLVGLTPPGPNAPEPPPQHIPLSSFAFNAPVFAPTLRRPGSYTDGESNTLAVSEHHGRCGPTPTAFGVASRGTNCKAQNGGVVGPVPCSGMPGHRSTFADHPMYDDVRPVTATRDGRAVTVGSLPLTFQVRPALADCDPRIPQSSLPGGILAGMLDGSVRFLRPDVAPEAFWGSVTPAGGEGVSLD